VPACEEKIDFVIVIAYYDRNSLLTSDFCYLLDQLDCLAKVVVAYVGNLIRPVKTYENVDFIKFDDVGYDLNSYLIGLEKIRSASNVKKYIFINNSILVKNVTLFIHSILLMVNRLESIDFIGFVKSFEEREHYQTFFFGMTRQVAESKFFNRFIERGFHERPISRIEVIEEFELNTCDCLNICAYNHDSLFKPTTLDYLVAYLNYLFVLGFFDNAQALIQPKKLNMATYSKVRILRVYGFKKIKGSSLINKFNKVYEKFKTAV